MNRTEELDKIDRTIKDLEIRLGAIKNSVGQIEKELSVLKPKKLELEQNIRFQKKDGTVPIAHEYKKAKAELARTIARLILIGAEYKKAVDVIVKVEEMIDKNRKDYYNLIVDSQNNVLQGSFGGNRGKS